MDTNVPLVDRSISAHTLAEKFDEVVVGIDRLRLLQHSEPPPTLPPWWNAHLRDAEWLSLTGAGASGFRPGPMAHAHWCLDRVLTNVLALYGDLTEGLELSPAERSAIKNAETALRAMKSVVSSPQSCPKLYWYGVPEDAQLEATFQKIDTPGGVPEEDCRRLDEVDDVFRRHIVFQEFYYPTEEGLSRGIEAEMNSLRDQLAQRGPGLPPAAVEPRERIRRVVRAWRSMVKKWRLAEEGIRRALAVLRGAPAVDVEAPAPPACTVVGMGPDVLESLRRMVAGEFAVAGGKKLIATSKAPDVRPWVQSELDAAIWKQVLAHEEDIRNLERRLADARTRDAAKAEATERWGARPLARTLGVMSHAMVTKSPGWLVLAKRLGLRKGVAGAKPARKGMETVEDRVAQVTEPKPDEAAAARIDADALEAALAKIPPKQRDPLRDQFRKRESTLEQVIEIARTLAREVAP